MEVGPVLSHVWDLAKVTNSPLRRVTRLLQ